MKPIYRAAAIKRKAGHESKPDLWAVVEERNGSHYILFERFASYAEAESRAHAMNYGRRRYLAGPSGYDALL